VAERNLDEVVAGLEAATPEEPFLMSKAELIAHIEAIGGTGCGGYSTVGSTGNQRDVSWDYACRD
jgi:hypothetical protein